MKKKTILFFVTATLVLLSFKTHKENHPPKLYSMITQYIREAEKDFDKIPAERKIQLQKITGYIQASLAKDNKANLVFICTHNSRRSHMAQLWAYAASVYYGVNQVASYSGGTEVTAFNPNAVKALVKAGFQITVKEDGTNPHYAVKYSDEVPALIAYSKKYTDSANPSSHFAAVMTCSHADANCPVVFGAALKISTPYEDPKESDGNPNQEAVYDERCKQIATELLYAFSLVKQQN